MTLRVVVIVEGHGEDEAIRTLLWRIWFELLKQEEYMEVISWRRKQGQLRTKEGLSNAVEAAAIKLHYANQADQRRLLLIMVDTEGECAKTISAEMLAWAKETRQDTDFACVMPHPMFETWFAAAAESLRGKNGLPADLVKPENPEAEGVGKSWIKKHLPRKYKETIDQPRFAGQMNLAECKASSRSFRKLIKELEKRRHSK